MRRRDFIAAIGSLAVWPLAARAQQSIRPKRIAWIGTSGEDAVSFAQELAKLGWMEGHDIRVVYRIKTEDQALRAMAPSLVGGAPDVIVTVGTNTAEIIKQLTSTIPIVFNNVADPVAARLVVNFAHPGGNATGFSNLQFSFSGKWLSLLKDLVPGITKVIVLYETANSNWQGFLPVLEAAAPSVGVIVHPASAVTSAEIVNIIENFPPDPNTGMIVLPTGLTVAEHTTIAALVARRRIPTIYPFKFFVTGGGLISYGVSTEDEARRTAHYVDRILRGEKPADLPVQAPVKFELVFNLKTARSLGLEVPPLLLAIADEVIE